MIEKVIKTEDEWIKTLTPEQYAVMRMKDTEAPYSCEFKKNMEMGAYSCAACGLELFRSSAKFDSGTGWPSFYEPISPDRLIYKEDKTSGMPRTEVLCARCDSHLGHVFHDGPAPTGNRYCMNGIALIFKKS